MIGVGGSVEAWNNLNILVLVYILDSERIITITQGAALATMAALLTYGNRKYEHLDAQLRAVLPKLHDAYEHMLPLVDRDTLAFTNYIVSLRTLGQYCCKISV